MRAALLFLLLVSSARADVAVKNDEAACRARPIPKLVTAPGRTVSAEWIQKDQCVLQVTVNGHFYIGALNNLVSVGGICPDLGYADARRLSVTFHRIFPKDGDVVKVRYGMHQTCAVRDSYVPLAEGADRERENVSASVIGHIGEPSGAR